MIRRDCAHEYQLITQHDHALLAGRLARHLGNTHFDRPQPFDAVVRAISLHDCGWPVHDDHPTLNAQGRPTDVFETPLPISLKVWSASVDRAMEQGAYEGLLVSLHVLWLSSRNPPHSTPRDIFELNKFQHRQVEIQEALRRQLHLNVDQPLTWGLATGGDDPRERALERNFHILQAMDLLSLAICRANVPAIRTAAFPPRMGLPAQCLTWEHRGNDLIVKPWPFDRATIQCHIPYRAIPARPYPADSAFHDEFAAAPVLKLERQVRQST